MYGDVHFLEMWKPSYPKYNRIWYTWWFWSDDSPARSNELFKGMHLWPPQIFAVLTYYPGHAPRMPNVTTLRGSRSVDALGTLVVSGIVTRGWPPYIMSWDGIPAFADSFLSILLDPIQFHEDPIRFPLKSHQDPIKSHEDPIKIPLKSIKIPLRSH